MTWEGLVSAEFSSGENTMVLYRRNGDRVTASRLPATFAFITDRPEFLPEIGAETSVLAGNLDLRYRAQFSDYASFRQALGQARTRAERFHGRDWQDHIWQRNPVETFLMMNTITPFAGLDPDDLKVVAIDLETFTTGGKIFPSAKDLGDEIIVASLADNRGNRFVFDRRTLSERDILLSLCEVIVREDYDVICGHNIMGFDLPYIHERAVGLGLALPLGRDGSTMRQGRSRTRRMLSDNEFYIFGRHIIDTLPLLMSWDIGSRSLSNWQLKSAVYELGISSDDRRDFDRDNISQLWRSDPAALCEYGLADAVDALALYRFLCPPEFYQAQLLPLNYQQAVQTGSGTRVDLLILERYFEAGHSLPVRGALAGNRGAGGLTEAMSLGIHSDVRKVDVASLYPSICLTYGIHPRTDELGCFLTLLRSLTERRLTAKSGLRDLSPDSGDYRMLHGMQSSFKILINSFYGMLGTEGLYFCDAAAAMQITSRGQEILRQMVANIESNGGRPIEIDTDGVFFTWADSSVAPDRIVNLVSEDIPAGIRVEFDGAYDYMYSYAAKNYLLLSESAMTRKGVVFRSRRLCAFQSEFIDVAFTLLCSGNTAEISRYYQRLRERIMNREMDLSMVVTTHPVDKSWEEYGRTRQKSRSKFLDLVYWRQDRDRWTVRSRISYYHSENGPEGVRLAEEFSGDIDTTYYLDLLRKTAEKFIYALPPDSWATVFGETACGFCPPAWNFRPAENPAVMADYDRVLRGDHQMRLF